MSMGATGSVDSDDPDQIELQRQRKLAREKVQKEREKKQKEKEKKANVKQSEIRLKFDNGLRDGVVTANEVLFPKLVPEITLITIITRITQASIVNLSLSLSLSLYIYIYIYIQINGDSLTNPLTRT